MALPFNLNLQRRRYPVTTPPFAGYSKDPTYPTINPDYIPSDNNEVNDEPRKTHDPVLNPTLETGIDPAILADAHQPTMRPTQPLETPAPPPYEENRTPAVTYEDGRPVSAEGPDHLEAQRALLKATRDYIPQKATGRRRWHPVAQGAVAGGIGGRGHPLAFAGGAFAGLIRSLFNRKAADEDWKRRREAEISEGIDEELSDRYREAQIGAMQTNAELKPETLKSKALAEYMRLDSYDPDDPQHAGLRAYFESRGLFNLPKRSKMYAPDVRLVGGQLVITNKGTGKAQNVVNQQTGATVEDPSKRPTHKVKIGGQVYENLTAREAAILEGRLYQGAQNRASREDIAKKNRDSREKIAREGQAGQDRRNTERINATDRRQGVLNPTTRGAILAISRFRTLTTQIARAEEFGTPETAQALRDQRDGHERMMRSVYGDRILDDDKGKPTVLNEDYLSDPDDEESGGEESGEGGASEQLDVNEAIEHFKKKHKRAPTAKEIENMRRMIENQ